MLGRAGRSTRSPAWEQLAERIPVGAAGESDAGARPSRSRPSAASAGSRSPASTFFGGTVYAFRDITDAHRLEELQAEFIATASHELRTPLAAVYGAAQTLRRHDFALDEAGRERFISLIVDESERLGRIVNQILLANQLDVGRLDLVTEPFDGGDLLERVVEAARDARAAAHPLRASSRTACRPSRPTRTACARCSSTSSRTRSSTRPTAAGSRLGVEPDRRRGRFRVRDEGLGIPVDEQARIFEKFYRLDPDMTRGIGGTGLGLYICSELRRAHGRPHLGRVARRPGLRVLLRAAERRNAARVHAHARRRGRLLEEGPDRPTRPDVG